MCFVCKRDISYVNTIFKYSENNYLQNTNQSAKCALYNENIKYLPVFSPNNTQLGSTLRKVSHATRSQIWHILCSEIFYRLDHKILNTRFWSTAEIRLSKLSGTVCHPDMQDIRINGIFFVKYITVLVGISAVTIYSMYPRLNILTMPALNFYKPYCTRSDNS